MIKLICHITFFYFFKILEKLKIFRTFSQEGEDLIITRLLKKKNFSKEDFFVDFGAGHPIKYSNTFSLYLNGLRGISVDANKRNIFLHKILRPYDFSNKMIISQKSEKKYFYSYTQSELNTSSEERADLLKKKNIFYKSKILLETISVKDFFKRYSDILNKNIIFFNLDVEGLELEILNEIDWTKFKPKIICVEIINLKLDDIENNKLFSKLKSENYNLESKLYNSVIFIHNEK